MLETSYTHCRTTSETPSMCPDLARDQCKLQFDLDDPFALFLDLTERVPDKLLQYL